MKIDQEKRPRERTDGYTVTQRKLFYNLSHAKLAMGQITKTGFGRQCNHHHSSVCFHSFKPTDVWPWHTACVWVIWPYPGTEGQGQRWRSTLIPTPNTNPNTNAVSLTSIINRGQFSSCKTATKRKIKKNCPQIPSTKPNLLHLWQDYDWYKCDS